VVKLLLEKAVDVLQGHRWSDVAVVGRGERARGSGKAAEIKDSISSSAFDPDIQNSVQQLEQALESSFEESGFTVDLFT
jgi:hypothetical protein